MMSGMTRHALCIGINRYGAGMDLAGCVQDARDWAEELTRREFQVDMLLDAQATKAAILEAIEAKVRRARSGDTVVLTFSGHGSRTPDLNGDEADRWDELLCPTEIMRTGEGITDDELHDVFGQRARGTRIVMISDSCHSGTVSRFAGPLIPKDNLRRARFLPPSAFFDAEAHGIARALPTFVPPAPPRYPSLLMSGCADPEYSYDAWFNGRPNGAFTRVALDTLTLMSSVPSYREWHAAIRRRLPSVDYPQTPQLYGTWAQKNWRALG